MSDAQAGFTAARIDEVLRATFAGTVPDLVDRLVDRELAARFVDDTKVGFVFRLGDDEQPRIRLSIEHEKDRVVGLLGEAWGDAGSFLGDYPEAHALADVDGGGSVRLMGVHVAQRDDGSFEVTGDLLQLPAGDRWTLTTYTSAPTDKLKGELKDRVAALVDAGAAGQWHVRWSGDDVHSVLWVTERPWTPVAAKIVEGLGGGPRLQSVRALLEHDGDEVDPYLVELYADGTTDVCIWGVRRPVDDSPEARIFLSQDGTSVADAFADKLAICVPTAEHDAARTLAAGTLFPAIEATQPAEMERIAHLSESWKWLVDRLAAEPPFTRLGVLEDIAAITKMSSMADEAYALGVARYVASHPDAVPPEGLELPAGAAAELAARATAMLEEAAASIQRVKDVADLDLNRIPHVPFIAKELEDTLQRVISADFTAAEGRLHDWFLQLGPGGYDDDPSLASLDEIDLESDAAEAAIEEALAMDDDDDL